MQLFRIDIGPVPQERFDGIWRVPHCVVERGPAHIVPGIYVSSVMQQSCECIGGANSLVNGPYQGC